MAERGALVGRVAVVTGAGHGIGRALAVELAAAGARVALLDLDAEAARAAAASIGGAAVAFGCDVTDPAIVSEVMGEVRGRLGAVDVLVNNAGISHHSLAAETELAVLRRVMEVNFYGAVHCTLAALPSLVERRGVVVAMSSVAGFGPLYRRSGYAASKHALHGWFDTLRSEVGPQGVAVMIVCPSFVRTGIDGRALAGDGGPARRDKAVVGRPAEPEDVARAVVAGIVKRRRQLVLTPVGRAAYWLTRLAPGLYERVMRRRQA